MKSIIPQIIIPISLKAVKFLQEKYPCTEKGGASTSFSPTECMKECKSVWLTFEQLEKISEDTDGMDYKLSTECCYLIVLSWKFEIGHVCFSAGDIHTLNDCVNCIHFHDAIVKED